MGGREEGKRPQWKPCAVAEPGEKEGSEDKDDKEVLEVSEGQETSQAKQQKKKPAPKKKREKKEPWPLSRYTAQASTTGKTTYNIIANRSQWPTGVPSVMGGHLMPSGEVAPTTVSPTTIDDVYDAAKTQYVHPFHYYDQPRLDGTRERSQVEVYNTKQDLGAAVCDAFVKRAKESVEAKGSFACALSGGSLINMLGGLKDRKQEVEWSKVYVTWVDERLCDLGHQDSNAGAAIAAFIREVGLPEGNHLTIDGALTVDQAARHYEGQLLQLGSAILPTTEGGLPKLDLVVLGMGPDGHVASLFPNRKELAESPEQWVLPVRDSPKPPSQRITMTMDVINASGEVLLVAAGKGKAEIVQRVLEHQSLPGALPAQLVSPTQGRLAWMLDAESATDITPTTWEDKKAWPRNKIE